LVRWCENELPHIDRVLSLMRHALLDNHLIQRRSILGEKGSLVESYQRIKFDLEEFLRHLKAEKTDAA
jgi:hypothetical protein